MFDQKIFLMLLIVNEYIEIYSNRSRLAYIGAEHFIGYMGLVMICTKSCFTLKISIFENELNDFCNAQLL